MAFMEKKNFRAHGRYRGSLLGEIKNTSRFGGLAGAMKMKKVTQGLGTKASSAVKGNITGKSAASKKMKFFSTLVAIPIKGDFLN